MHSLFEALQEKRRRTASRQQPVVNSVVTWASSNRCSRGHKKFKFPSAELQEWSSGRLQIAQQNHVPIEGMGEGDVFQYFDDARLQ